MKHATSQLSMDKLFDMLIDKQFDIYNITVLFKSTIDLNWNLPVQHQRLLKIFDGIFILHIDKLFDDENIYIINR